MNSEAIILDFGSGSIKAGFQDEDKPRVVFPSTVAFYRYKDVLIGMAIMSKIVGDIAQESRGYSLIKYPLEHGLVQNWESMESLLSHCFYNQLTIAPEDHCILMTQPLFYSKKDREKMIELLFETFQIPHLTFVNTGTLAIYSTGCTNGVIVESGDGITSILPIYHSYPIYQCGMRINFGGREITKYLVSLLNENSSGFHFRTTAEQEIIQTMKESYSYTALDFEKEMKLSNFGYLNCEYELPDGQRISVRSERFRCNEAIFKPYLLNLEFDGIHELLLKSILKCDVDIRQDLLKHIVLCGGNTMSPGFSSRLHKELIYLTPTGTNIKIFSPPERKYSVWLGGSLLAAHPSFKDLLVSHSDYNEYGISLVDQKCF